MTQMEWKLNKIYGQLMTLLLAVLLLVYFGANQDDYYNTSILPSGFTVVENDPALQQSDRLMLEKGSYTFTVAYTAQGEATAEIINDLAADAQGNPSPVLTAAELNPAQNQTALTLTLDQTTRGIRVVLHGNVNAGVTQVLSDRHVWNDTVFFMLSILLIAGICVLLGRKNKEGTFPESLAWMVCLIAGCVASMPVLRDFFVYGHDLAFHLTRIESIKDGLLSGQFPVRIDPTFLNGYGYASSVMYGDMLLYIPALLRLCGVSMMVSWQAFVIFINAMTACLTYRVVKAWTGRTEIGLIAGVVYTLGIYRLMTLFTRAAAGEAMAMMFYPMVIEGIAATVWESDSHILPSPYNAAPTNAVTRRRGMAWLIIGMTGMLQTHLISLQIAAIGCALYTVACACMRRTSWKGIGRLGVAAGITVLINLWFLVPFFTFSALNLDIFHQEKLVYLHAAYVPQLFATFVDPYAGMTTFPGTTVEMPLSVGLLLGVSFIMFLFVSYRKREMRPGDMSLYVIAREATIFAVLTLLASTVVFPWTYIHQIPILNKVLFAVQFPWRYLGAASALLAIVFAVSAYMLVKKPEHRRLLVLACLLLAILNAMPFIDAAIQSDKQQVIVKDKYADFVAPVHLPGDYFFEGTDVDAYMDRAPVPAVVAGDARLSAYSKRYLTLAFDYTASADSTVELPLYGYPVYRAMMNDHEQLALSTGENNILTVTLPAGSGTVEITYHQPWTFTAADIFSLLAILVLLAWFVPQKYLAGKIEL